jgi:hypothetical protein
MTACMVCLRTFAEDEQSTTARPTNRYLNGGGSVCSGPEWPSTSFLFYILQALVP